MAITVSAGCVILDLGEGEHMKKNGSIRQQVQRLLFLCSVVSLLLLGGIALLGMMGARENSRQSGYEMGEEAALTVSTTLRKEAEERMQLLASERAAQIGLELQRIADRTELMRSEISWIMEHTGDYPLRNISEPRRENAGQLVPQLELAAGLDRGAVAQEIGLMANAQDIMLQVAVQNGEGTAISAASKNGFTISVDKDSAARFTSPEAVAPAPFGIYRSLCR